jgi:hypothetical protein
MSNICKALEDMKTQIILKRITAILLLAVFMLSVTPKKTLHDLFARHKDLSAASADAKNPFYLQSGFRCHCDNLVVESPFVGCVHAQDTPAADFHVILNEPAPEKYCAVVGYYTGLRGPPSAVSA